MRIVCEFINNCLEVLLKNSCSENFGTFSGKHSYWDTNLIKLWNEALNFTKTVLYNTTSAFLGVF